MPVAATGTFGEDGDVRIRGISLILGVAFSASGAGVVLAAPAYANCISSEGITICAQGQARGPDTGEGPVDHHEMGPYFPYPCESDFYCEHSPLDYITEFS